MRRLLLLLAVLLLAGCAGTAKKPGAAPGQVAAGPAAAGAPDCTGFKPYPPAREDLSTRGHYVAGGLYRPGVRDSTPDHIPNVDCIPEPRVVDEPRSAYGNRSPYQVLGRTYHVLDSADDYVETGVASYYGAKFHGRRTSNQEVYDMYAFTAAHRSLPLPSYARVTNLDNGRSVVVRVNDRGPFHEGRLIDLSYAAAVKLDIHRQGTGRVEVRALRPGDAEASTLQAAAPVPAAPPAAQATGMDALVGQLATTPDAPAPRAVATVAGAAPAGRPAGLADHPDYGREEDRFRLVDDNGRVRSADEFDAWMRARHARLAAADAAPSRAASAAPAPAVAAAAAPAPSATGEPVTLQVGVFSVRDNAERVLATLRGAGIAQAWMQDVASAGRTLWRVRVGPVGEAALAELSARVSGLGLGMPQVVRD
ncbi:MAG: septal ring lytic transglycosylase RlpA family protein [Xanthomonadaceae bacterium]|nr:septal ring lytic transglycosylase RlpA family protein [Xanthomonadaceae bacterium]